MSAKSDSKKEPLQQASQQQEQPEGIHFSVEGVAARQKARLSDALYENDVLRQIVEEQTVTIGQLRATLDEYATKQNKGDNNG